MAVSLSSQIVRRLAEETPGSARRGQATGLLFGLAEEHLAHIQAFKPFPKTDRHSSELRQPAAFDEIVKDMRKTWQADPDTAALSLIGWYSVRASGVLTQSDVAFHERHFDGLSHVILILTPEERAGIPLRVYARSAEGLLNQEEHRRGELRLSEGAQPAGPIQVALSQKGKNQLYIRAYGNSLDRPDCGEPWKDVVQSTKRMALSVFSSMRFRPGETVGPDRQQAAEKAASLRRAGPVGMEAAYSTMPGAFQPIEEGGPPRLPQKKDRRRSWGRYAAVFAIATGAIFVALELFRAVLPNTELGLQAESKGEGILLSWNRRNPIVQSAMGGNLQIEDGKQHREVHLDAEQIANGALLYRPSSDDVTFRIELRGERGATIRRSMRVLDGERGQLVELSAAKAPANGAAMPVGLASLPGGDLDKKFTSGIEPSANKAIRLRNPLSAFPQPASSSEDKFRSAPDTVPHAESSQESGAKRPAALVTSNGPLLLDAGTTPEPPSNAQLPDYVSQPGSGSKAARPGDTTAPTLAPPKLEPGGVSGGKELPNPPPSATEAKPSQIMAAPAPPGNVATAYVPPRPLRQFMPNPRPWIIASPSEIEVEVKLDENGHVETARLVRQNGKLPLSLIGATLAAARQWTFKPATLRGIKAESNDTIVFRFRPTNP